MFRVTKKNHEAIQRAKSFGVERFRLSVEELQGCFFTLSLSELVDEESFVDQKLATLANRRTSNVHVDANRLLAATYDLAEIQFCLGLFAIASDLSEVINADDSTSAEDIYMQLMEHKLALPKDTQDLFDAAEDSVNRAGLFVGSIVNGVVAVNRVAFNAGVGLARFVRKQSKTGLNKFGSWLADKTK